MAQITNTMGVLVAVVNNLLEMKLKKENNICFKIIQFKYIENVKKTVILLQQQRSTLKKSIENVKKIKTVQLKCIVCCK